MSEPYLALKGENLLKNLVHPLIYCNYLLKELDCIV
jgi:hypothetical protein